MLLCFSLQLSSKSASTLFPTIFSVSVFLDCPCVIHPVSPPAFSLLSPLSSVISVSGKESSDLLISWWLTCQWPLLSAPSVIPHTVPFQLCHRQGCHDHPGPSHSWTFTLYEDSPSGSTLLSYQHLYLLPFALGPSPTRSLLQSPQGFLHSCSQSLTCSHGHYCPLYLCRSHHYIFLLSELN